MIEEYLKICENIYQLKDTLTNPNEYFKFCQKKKDSRTNEEKIKSLEESLEKFKSERDERAKKLYNVLKKSSKFKNLVFYLTMNRQIQLYSEVICFSCEKLVTEKCQCCKKNYCNSCKKTDERFYCCMLRMFTNTFIKEKCSYCFSLNNTEKGKFKKCSQCLSQYYCSKECQIKHWNEKHKAECLSKVILVPMNKRGQMKKLMKNKIDISNYIVKYDNQLNNLKK